MALNPSICITAMAAAAPDGMQKLEEFSSGLEKGQAVNVWWGGDGCCYEGKVVSSLKLKGSGAGQVIYRINLK